MFFSCAKTRLIRVICNFQFIFLNSEWCFRSTFNLQAHHFGSIFWAIFFRPEFPGWVGYLTGNILAKCSIYLGLQVDKLCSLKFLPYFSLSSKMYYLETFEKANIWHSSTKIRFYGSGAARQLSFANLASFPSLIVQTFRILFHRILLRSMSKLERAWTHVPTHRRGTKYKRTNKHKISQCFIILMIPVYLRKYCINQKHMKI